MPDQLAAANTYTYTRTVITRSVDGVTRHTRHRVQGRQAAHVFDIGLRHHLGNPDTHTHTHTQGPRQITSHDLY